MHPCWEGEGGNRPTFSKLESILGEYLGEEGIKKFKVRFKYHPVRYYQLNFNWTSINKEAHPIHNNTLSDKVWIRYLFFILKKNINLNLSEKSENQPYIFCSIKNNVMIYFIMKMVRY